MPSASSTSTSASVPLAQLTVSGTPSSSAHSRSNASTSGPKMNRPDSMVRAKASFSSSASGAYCARTSTCGIGMARAHRRRPPAADGQVRDEQHDQHDDRDLDVGEVVVELRVAGAEPPADPGEHEAPDRV